MTGIAKRIVAEATGFQKTIEELRNLSKPWPEILTKDLGTMTYLSTLVRIHREGTWYLVHCVESFQPVTGDFDTEVFFIKKLVQQVTFIQTFWIVGGKIHGLPAEYVDPFQGSEEERLVKTYPWLPGGKT